MNDHPLSARTAYDETPAGAFKRAAGVTDQVPYALIEQRVEEIRAVYRERFRRELLPDEERHARIGAELRGAPQPAAREFPTVPELVQAVNASNPGAGWNWSPPHNPRGSGVAMRFGDDWTGDPAVIAATRAAEAEKAAARAEQHERWATGPAIMRTVTGPS